MAVEVAMTLEREMAASRTCLMEALHLAVRH